MSGQIYSVDGNLNPVRRKTSTISGRDLRQEVASDRARVLFSNPFRRLQLKTQVFPLDINTAVRTRMTHSLEVAHIGRSISEVIATTLPETDDSKYQTVLAEIAQLVETACFLHDIGNPPFGHFGEEAISQWFIQKGYQSAKAALGLSTDQEPDKQTEYLLKNELLPDFYCFDGNSQGLRIVTRLQWNRDEFSLNLTYPQLAAFIKYVRCANEPVSVNASFTKKPGWFHSEAKIVEDVRSALGLSARARHPLVYITEAADDIAYCVSDLEDGMEKSLITESEFFDDFIQQLKQLTIDKKEQERIQKLFDLGKQSFDPEFPVGKFLTFKTIITPLLVDAAASVYVENHQEILKGVYPTALLKGDRVAHHILKSLKSVAINRLYVSQEAEYLEIAGYRVIFGILDAFLPLLQCKTEAMHKIIGVVPKEDDYKRGLVDRLYNRLAPKYRREYQERVNELDEKDCVREWFHRAHLVMDHVAGMTDRYALDAYHLLSGIRTAN